MRWVSTRVLPEPAPASTSSGPSPWLDRLALRRVEAGKQALDAVGAGLGRAAPEPPAPPRAVELALQAHPPSIARGAAGACGARRGRYSQLFDDFDRAAAESWLMTHFFVLGFVESFAALRRCRRSRCGVTSPVSSSCLTQDVRSAFRASKLAKPSNSFSFHSPPSWTRATVSVWPSKLPPSKAASAVASSPSISIFDDRDRVRVVGVVRRLFFALLLSALAPVCRRRLFDEAQGRRASVHLAGSVAGRGAFDHGFDLASSSPPPPPPPPQAARPRTRSRASGSNSRRLFTASLSDGDETRRQQATSAARRGAAGAAAGSRARRARAPLPPSSSASRSLEPRRSAPRAP